MNRFEVMGEQAWFDPVTLEYFVGNRPGPFSKGHGNLGCASESRVRFVTLNIAHDCNLACDYCFAEQGTFGAERGFMDRATAFRSVDWLLAQSKDEPRVYIRFLGGEPLLNVPLMHEVCNYAWTHPQLRGREVVFSVNTNGTIFDESIERLVQQYRMTVSISLDGLQAENDKHRRMRSGHGSYTRVMRNLGRFSTVAPFLMVNATITSDSGRLLEFTGELRRHGVRLIRTALVGTTQDGVRVEGHDSLAHLVQEYRKLARSYLQDLEGGDCWYFADFYKYFEVLNARVPRTGRCGAGTWYGNIDMHGDVHLCHRFTAAGTHVMTNVFSDEGLPSSATPQPSSRQRAGRKVIPILADGLSAGSLPHRRLDGTLMLGSGPPCDSCEIRGLCGGECFHDSYIRSGSEKGAPDVAKCELDRELAKLSMWIYASLQDRRPGVFAELARLHTASIQNVM